MVHIPIKSIGTSALGKVDLGIQRLIEIHLYGCDVAFGCYTGGPSMDYVLDYWVMQHLGMDHPPSPQASPAFPLNAQQRGVGHDGAGPSGTYQGDIDGHNEEEHRMRSASMRAVMSRWEI
ncbi:unnamed protein product [Lactuca saligna]|uniref:Uncharacterized protein n=1 Tax=Lactuca saligna TaxID=75948 RepID=A0AA35V0Z8_LACSI|nr:unnamed protein product [Lactuca saligna]